MTEARVVALFSFLLFSVLIVFKFNLPGLILVHNNGINSLDITKLAGAVLMCWANQTLVDLQ